MPINPPPGFDDMLGDAEDTPEVGNYHAVEVEGIGTVYARKPMPNAVPNLAMSGRADIGGGARAGHLTRFVRSHLQLGEADRILCGMADDELPADSFVLIASALAVWGTSRPTGPSSISR